MKKCALEPRGPARLSSAFIYDRVLVAGREGGGAAPRRPQPAEKREIYLQQTLTNCG